ncbi:hypothetical protein P154DRAFT_518238 [Amniculicola lignicola CBS 123094]|uniref:Uncharacterized protein n=1 Tax=Amniculicola lignicola CBS 123094 TaxID=1392246 RepID=A0A6A5WW91_9PLEO|nr:hypothetical protein P154DRAFT_518238 [Amniculicola lignicola CBS 123094]
MQTSPTGLRVLYLITPALLLLLPTSILIVLLDRISRTAWNNSTTTTWLTSSDQLTLTIPPNSGLNATNSLLEVDVAIDRAPQWAFIGLALVAFIASILDSCAIWELRRIEGSRTTQRVWMWILFVVNFCVFGASIGLLGWASALQGAQKWSGIAAVEKAERATVETWSCMVDEYFPSEAWAKHVCGLSKATRLLLIPLALSALLVLVSAYILTRDRGSLSWLFGGKGRYAGFPDLYPMQPHQHQQQQPFLNHPYQGQGLPQGPPQGQQQYGMQPQVQRPAQTQAQAQDLPELQPQVQGVAGAGKTTFR